LLAFFLLFLLDLSLDLLDLLFVDQVLLLTGGGSVHHALLEIFQVSLVL
jgi:hypothetical protein